MQTPNGPEATVCVGYTCTLPEVSEAARALGWRQDGHLKEFYDGEPLTPILKDALDILATEIKRVEAFALQPKDKR